MQNRNVCQCVNTGIRGAEKLIRRACLFVGPMAIPPELKSIAHYHISLHFFLHFISASQPFSLTRCSVSCFPTKMLLSSMAFSPPAPHQLPSSQSWALSR